MSNWCCSCLFDPAWCVWGGFLQTLVKQLHAMLPRVGGKLQLEWFGIACRQHWVSPSNLLDV